MNEELLDKLIPIPALQEEKEAVMEELAEAGFAITNGRTGGVFATIILIVLQVKNELLKLARVILRNMFLDSAEGDWVELKAADFSKARKLASRTRGVVTCSRQAAGDPVKISKGTVFQTPLDSNGDILRYIADETVTMAADALSIAVPATAEYAGARYNVSAGQITRSLINLEGVDAIANGPDWIVSEGTDLEDIESLRARTKRSWAELATMPVADKYKNTCEAVSGVLAAEIYDQHPRGQGTIDIYITSSSGEATEQLLNMVKEAVDQMKGPYDNVQIMSTESVLQNVSLSIDIPRTESVAGVVETAQDVIKELLTVRAGKKLNQLTHTDIIYGIRSKVNAARAIHITAPAADVILERNKIIALGELSVTVTQVD